MGPQNDFNRPNTTPEPTPANESDLNQSQSYTPQSTPVDPDGEPPVVATQNPEAQQPAAQNLSTTQPAAAQPETASSFGSNKKPGLGKKKIILIIVGIVALLIAVSASAFAYWYNAPQNVLGDSLRKTFAAQSMNYDGVIGADGKGNDDNLQFNVAFDGASNRQMTSLNSTFNYSADEIETELKSSFVADTGEGNVYVRVENVDEILRQLAGESSQSDALAIFDDLVALIDNKWVVITNEDIEELTGESLTDAQTTCTTTAFETFQDNKDQQREVSDAYESNQFIIVKNDYGIKTVNGRMSNHYELGFDNEKADAFGSALLETTVFKAVDDCYDGELSENIDMNSDEEEDPTENAKVEVWIDVINHEPVKLKLSQDSEEATVTIEVNTQLNSNPTINTPEAETTVDDLMQEFESIQSQIFGPQSPSSNQFFMTDPTLST